MERTHTPLQLTDEQAVAFARDGWCLVPDVLSRDLARRVRQSLVTAIDEYRRRGGSTWIQGLDPNDRNIRVFNLLDLDPIFLELIRHPLALDGVRRVLGEHFLISNFTANIALPGSRSMALHSDQALVIPEPWLEPWALNVIWCLDDVHDANGATRYLPGSHRISRGRDLPADAGEQLRPFEASSGSVILMEGRLWHTSGANRTANEERALLFGYYTRDFIRPQVNWNVVLSPASQASLDPAMRTWLGLDATANVRTAAAVLAADQHR